MKVLNSEKATIEHLLEVIEILKNVEQWKGEIVATYAKQLNKALSDLQAMTEERDKLKDQILNHYHGHLCQRIN